MKPSMRAGEAAFCVAAVFGAISAAHADPQALSPFVPVTIEDAYPTKTGNAEFQGVTYWDHGPSGKDLVTLAPEVKLGALPGAQLEFETPYALGSARGRDQGTITFGGLYNFNNQTDWLPAFALHDDYSESFGFGGASASNNSLRAIVSKSLGSTADSAPRLHINLTWLHATDPTDKQRIDRYAAAIGYTQLVSDKTAFVTDYVHQQNAAKGSAENLIEAGLRHEVNDTLALSAGAGFGFGQQSPDFRLLLAVQYDFKAF